MTPLLQRRFLVLSGKGGVGRTTVAAALARAGADAGKRVLVAQASSAERLGRLFGRFGPVGTEVVTLAPGIDAVNMTPQSALHQYGLMVLRSELVYLRYPPAPVDRRRPSWVGGVARSIGPHLPVTVLAAAGRVAYRHVA